MQRSVLAFGAPAPCALRKQLYGRGASHARGVPRLASQDKMDLVDQKQAIDIERLINVVHELTDKVDKLEGELSQAERRDRDRMIALRGIIRDSLVRVGAPAPEATTVAVMTRLEGAAAASFDEADADWDSYRNSFTLLMSKGYVQTVDQLRDKLLTTEWEIGLRPIALQLGVSRFEAQCAAAGTEISYDVMTRLYEDPTDLSVIADERVRGAARACIHAVEMEQRMACFHDCTEEAQKLAVQFSEGEFISKLLPDPIEHGVVDSLKKIVSSANSMSKFMGGGRA